jgi:hypothetical protein
MILKVCDVNDMDAKEPIACQEITVEGALAFLRLAKEVTTITTRYSKEDTEFRYVDSTLLAANDSEGTLNALYIWVEAVEL